jgi:hypothetical protein
MVLFVIVDVASEGVEGREGLDLVESDSSLIIKVIYYISSDGIRGSNLLLGYKMMVVHM